MEKIGILFVCTGNICRSPTAEAVFSHLIKSAGLDNAFIVGSAGTHGYHIGHAPDERAIATASKYGVDMSNLRARQVEAKDFQTFDYILAMDMGHYNSIKPMETKGCRAKLSMFAPDDVADPYYGQTSDFDSVYKVIENGCAVLLNKILQQNVS